MHRVSTNTELCREPFPGFLDHDLCSCLGAQYPDVDQSRSSFSFRYRAACSEREKLTSGGSPETVHSELVHHHGALSQKVAGTGELEGVRGRLQSHMLHSHLALSTLESCRTSGI